MSRQAELAEAMRMLVFFSDDLTCRWCQTRFCPDDLVLDHVIPRSICNLPIRKNFQTLCKSCNSIKGTKLPNEYPSWVPEDVVAEARRWVYGVMPSEMSA